MLLGARRWLILAGLSSAVAAVALSACSPSSPPSGGAGSSQASAGSGVPHRSAGQGGTAAAQARLQLSGLPVRAHGSYAGYARAAFGQGWADTNHNGCDDRDDVLHQQLHAVQVRPHTDGCVVVSGSRVDPYTGQTLPFQRGPDSAVNIDHVVALGNAWVSGASSWPRSRRILIANDPLNLLAVSTQANSDKGDADAAHWLPPQHSYWCTYVARQIAVKAKYQLSVTRDERQAMLQVLSSC